MATIDRRFNDGNKPSGSVKVVLASGDIAIAEDITFVEDSSSDDTMDELGQPDGGIYTPNKASGNATLLLPSFVTDIPQLLSLLVLPFRLTQAKLWILTKIEQPR